jgi:hypothetical protein
LTKISYGLLDGFRAICSAEKVSSSAEGVNEIMMLLELTGDPSMELSDTWES